MNMKLIGAIMIIVTCGGFGFYLSAVHRREECTLRELVAVLDYMECELQYRLTPLPTLCRQAAAESQGVLRQTFLALALELEDQISPDVERCMNGALSKVKDIPKLTYDAMSMLGKTLGRFDMEGQLKGLEGVRQECRRHLGELSQNREVRLRGYQTLGLCAGAALAILLI